MSSIKFLPAFTNRSKNITGADLAPLLDNSRGEFGAKQRPTVFSRIAIVGDGQPHAVIGGLQEKAKVFPFNLDLDPTITDEDAHVDDNLATVELSKGALLIDLNEIPDRNPALYLGANGTREMYGVIRTPRWFIITAAEELAENLWQYTGKQCRLDVNPANSATSPLSAHPDAAEVTLFNAREFGNTALAVYNGKIDVDDKLTSVNAVDTGVPVLATLMSYPKAASSTAGECWIFSFENKPTINCPTP